MPGVEIPRVEGIDSTRDPSAVRARPAIPGGGRRGAPWRRTLATAPGIAAALLPKVACPACWPAYAGILGSLGLGFLLDSLWLLPLTAVFLLVALAALALRARGRRGPGPLLLGLVAAGWILAGKFVLDQDALLYAGVLLLVGASMWNAWPLAAPEGASCPSCASPAGTHVDAGRPVRAAKVAQKRSRS